MAANVTIKDIAKEAGVHFSTVSLALRNDPRLSPATKERIQVIADKLGYVPNASLKALCAYREANRPHPIRSGLAYLSDKPLGDAFGGMVFKHAHDQAAKLGYNLQFYNLNEKGITLNRLRSIWWNCGLKGVLIGSFGKAGSELDDDWKQWICVAFGYSVQSPNFNRAVQDHFTNMTRHLQILRQRGYRRIGLHLPSSLSQRTHGLLHGAYLYDQVSNKSPRIPILSKHITKPAELLEWIRKHKLDLVMAEADTYQLLRKTKLKMPQDIGFSLLSWKSYAKDNPKHCAGFDMKAETLAENSISFLVSQIHENNYGLSETPKCLMVTGQFQDGETIRATQN
ncbi:LacI family DNA-binding transcriptional regulator [Cerasicoccus frondis]|uniref:LacI family DNA-binding transcriptional regulator n=1 Tax=Cerasicoccus frondis TaxID=490090 RepID=UPI0028529C0F|nr:LacI family DNA-binding transcriptional regulator [Cerasicoccus frondis]